MPKFQDRGVGGIVESKTRSAAKAFNALIKNSDSLRIYPADLANRTEGATFVESPQKNLPKIDILVNHAGVATDRAFNHGIFTWPKTGSSAKPRPTATQILNNFVCSNSFLLSIYKRLCLVAWRYKRITSLRSIFFKDMTTSAISVSYRASQEMS